jgi:acetyltransferase
VSIVDLDKIFEPNGVAVVGASAREGSVGRALVDNLIQGGFAGPIYPVNPKPDPILGQKTYPSLADVEGPMDLAVVAVPIARVPEVIADCGRQRIKGVIVVSAGGKEVGDSGREIESRIRDAARESGVRIIGPNCLGVVNTGLGLNATFAAHMPLEGSVALISQSGAICTAILDWSLSRGIGFSHFVSIGSMLDVDFGDLIDYLGSDPRVSSILLYIENLTNVRKFMSAARAVSRIKPIVVLKAGRSKAGARAAASHTGAMAGEDAVYDAAFARAGLVRVDTIGQLFDTAELMAKQPRPQGPNLAVVTNAGGPGVMAADACAAIGLEPAVLGPETMSRLDEVLPPHWSRGNPIDVLGDAPAERYSDVMDVLVTAPEVDAQLVILAPQAMTDPARVAEAVAGSVVHRTFPVFTCWMGGEDVAVGRDILSRAGLPTYDTPERAVRAFRDMYQYHRHLEMLREVPPRLPGELRIDPDQAGRLIARSLDEGQTLLTEDQAKDLLAAYGLPVNPTLTADSAQAAVDAAERAGWPVVLKLLSPDITHKTEAGGVRLDLRGPDEVWRAFEDILESARKYDPAARLDGVTVQAMARPGPFELIVGAKHDPTFGPVIMFGLGGILTELYRDRAVGLPPLNRLLARRLMEETRVWRLLTGYRNLPAVDLLRLEELLIRLSQLLIDWPEIIELDMNPVMIVDQRPLVVDARVVLARAGLASPRHLIIGPYPNQYEMRTVTQGGLEVFIRPIKPEDAPLLGELLESLSPQSVLFRFFRPRPDLSPDFIARLTQIDYDRDVALVALQQFEGGERMVGVARVMTSPRQEAGEFAVTVGDAWQGRGVGARLFERCIAVARQQGIKKIWGLVLPQNTVMLALARKFGCRIQHSPDQPEYEVRLDLTAASQEKPDQGR